VPGPELLYEQGPISLGPGVEGRLTGVVLTNEDRNLASLGQSFPNVQLTRRHAAYATRTYDVTKSMTWDEVI
jgi:hypothetical protein